AWTADHAGRFSVPATSASRVIDRGVALVADYLDEKYPGVAGRCDDGAQDRGGQPVEPAGDPPEQGAACQDHRDGGGLLDHHPGNGPAPGLTGRYAQCGEHDYGEYRQRDQADTEELCAERRHRLVRDQDERALAHGTEEQDDAFSRAACQPADAQHPLDVYGHGKEHQAGQDRADSGQRDSESFPGCDISRGHEVSRWWLTAAWAAWPAWIRSCSRIVSLKPMPCRMDSNGRAAAMTLCDGLTPVVAERMARSSTYGRGWPNTRSSVSTTSVAGLLAIRHPPRLTGSLGGYLPGDEPWLGGGGGLGRAPPRDPRPPAP